MFRWLLALCALVIVNPAIAGIDVQVSGVGGALRANVLAQLSIQAQSNEPQLDQATVEDLNRRAPAQIRTALQPFGYYRSRIDAALSGQAPHWTARYRIDPGPRTTLRTLSVAVTGAGRSDKKIRAVVARPGIAIGQPLLHQRWEHLKTRLSDVAYAQGYLDARFSIHRMQVDLDANAADLKLVLDTGPRYYVGPITIRHSHQIDDDVLRRYLRIQTGQPFDPQKVLDTQFALSDLGYFSDVTVQPDKAHAVDRRVPIIITATDAPRRQYRYGGGYGTDTGARALWSLDFRSLGRQGHKLRIDARVAQKISALIAEYRIPVGHQPSDYLGFEVEGLSQQLHDGQEEIYGAGVSYHLNSGSWRKNYYLKYGHDAFRFNNVPGTVSRLWTPGVQFSLAELDNPVFPRWGWSLFQDFHGAERALDSSATFVQSRSVLRAVISPLRRLRLLGRFEYGATLVSGFADLPASQRLFVGGTDSVRGYSYRSLGPHDALGNVIGGKYLETYSVQAEYRLTDKWGAALFTDAGGASDTPLPSLHNSVGAGALYYLPFGTAAVYLSHPLDSGTSPVRLDITIEVGL
ncbi:MAG: BamA/TamA family outer membrane protein [Gammaproteobacteria bacterium]|nr:BamA/TamA family outer membrane protein [Gammaproteobacteria bacterium]